MSKTSWRLILFVLAGSILGWVLIGPEPANASKTDSVKEVRISRLAKGINIPSWFWLNRDPVDDLEKRYPDTDFQLIKKLGFTNVRIPVDMANVYDKDQPDLLQKENLPYLDRGIKKILSYELAKGRSLKMFTVHSLRHSHLMTYVVDRKVPLPIVQKQVGHRSLKTTSVYLSPSTEKMAQAYRQARLTAEGGQ